MDVSKLDSKQAVKLFGWHAVHGPEEAVLRLPAGWENFVKMSVDASGREPLARYHEVEERGGCYALFERIKQRNWPCRAETPERNEQGHYYIIARAGNITVKREDLSDLGLPFTWRAMASMRVGYLVEFTDDSMVISSDPPEGASDDELAAMLWEHTQHPYAEYLDHIRGVRSLALSCQQPLDPERLIKPTPTPVGPPQHLHQFVDGERRMVWTRNSRQLDRFNAASIRHHHLLQNAPVDSDDFDASMAELSQMEQRIVNDPRYRIMQIVNRLTQSVTRKR